MENPEPESTPSAPNAPNNSGPTPASEIYGGRNPKTSSAAWKDASKEQQKFTTLLAERELSLRYVNIGHLFVLPVTVAAIATLAGHDEKRCSLLLGLIESKSLFDPTRSSKRRCRGDTLIAVIVMFGISVTLGAAIILINV